MWRDGELYRRKHGLTAYPKHTNGIYSLKKPPLVHNISIKQNDNVSRISHRVDTMKLNDLDDDNDNTDICADDNKKSTGMTQGDKLNKIKAQRRLVRPVLIGSML